MMMMRRAEDKVLICVHVLQTSMELHYHDKSVTRCQARVKSAGCRWWLVVGYGGWVGGWRGIVGETALGNGG